jgi:arylsulfatase A-like enzyme
MATTNANAQTVPAPRPNVLLILADDLGWSDISCMGSEIQTPNIDALGSGGLTFTQMYNSARCCPTRASLLTGLSPHQAGFPLMNGVLSNRSVTLPEVLDDAGYSTSMVGKWHLGEQSTPTNRGFQEFYGMLGGFNSFWKEDPWYTRAPAGRPKRQYKPGEFYSTDAFADYSIDFIDQSKASGKPWFQYLAFNAPHFPLQAPEADIAKYEKLYAQGWDKIREGRVQKQKKLGLLPKNVSLTPRSVVPKNWINEKTGWADKDNPAWDSLPADRQADLARRMAVYAAMVDRMDQAIGRVVNHLKETKQYDNTLIFFLSDNGACAEWDPNGFDKLDSTLNIIHKGEDLKKVGTDDSYISYGSGWANASNTPWRLYKHYGHEGGTRTPLLVHWPQGLKTKAGTRTDVPGTIADFMPTLVEVCGATYPTERNGQSILPTQGVSLAPMLKGGTLAARSIFMEHEGNRSVRQGDWKLVAIHDKPWELYNLTADPTEMNDLAKAQPARVEKMAADWETWAENSMVKPKPKSQQSPNLVGKAITITCEITPQAPNGVILAQGGNQRGYALLLQEGKPVFIVRQAGQLYTAAASQAPQGRFTLEAHMENDGAMRLLINGKEAARDKAPGVFTTQPMDELSIGEDVQSAVGTYQAPYSLKAKIENVKVTAQ